MRKEKTDRDPDLQVTVTGEGVPETHRSGQVSGPRSGQGLQEKRRSGQVSGQGVPETWDLTCDLQADDSSRQLENWSFLSLLLGLLKIGVVREWIPISWYSNRERRGPISWYSNPLLVTYTWWKHEDLEPWWRHKQHGLEVVLQDRRLWERLTSSCPCWPPCLYTYIYIYIWN